MKFTICIDIKQQIKNIINIFIASNKSNFFCTQHTNTYIFFMIIPLKYLISSITLNITIKKHEYMNTGHTKFLIKENITPPGVPFRGNITVNKINSKSIFPKLL